MKILNKKILTSILLLGVLALGITGCEKNRTRTKPQSRKIILEGIVLKEDYDSSLLNNHYKFVMFSQYGNKIISVRGDPYNYPISIDELALLIEEGSKIRVYYDPEFIMAYRDYISKGNKYTVAPYSVKILER